MDVTETIEAYVNAWAIVDHGGTVIEGVDFVVRDDGGRIASATGFFGPLDGSNR